MRGALLGIGLVTLAACWLLPLEAFLPGAFSAHMTMHMGVVAVAAPLLALGLAGSRLDPVRVAPWLFPPIPLSVLELVVVWAWHAPQLHQFARHSHTGLALEQGSFLLAGLAVWLSAFGGGAVGQRDRQGTGVLALLLTSMHVTLLGALLALPPRVLYAHAGHEACASAISPLDDQHLGGAIMLCVGGIAYLAGALWLTFRLLRPSAGADPGGARGKRVKRPTWAQLRRPVIGLSVLAVAGVVGMLSGIVPIDASSGHWAVTAWFLDFAKVRSVSTHALGATAPPDLDAPWRVVHGAAHYDGGCRPCHGSPGVPPPPIAAAMTPSPPDLAPLMARWEPEELFYIVKHGIKFTGMPAWPSQERDDEVWSMAAFLVVLPELDAASYERLVRGDAPVPHGTEVPLAELAPTAPVPGLITLRCVRCHGLDGMGRGSPAFPRIAGQSGEYLFGAMEAYARGERNSGTMEPVAVDLTPDEWRAAADYYAGLPTGSSQPVAEAHADPRIERGESIATAGVPSQDVPSCMDCHGPSAHSHEPAYPRLAGQHAEYLVGQLELFADDRRGGSAHAHLMQEVAPRLTAEQMRDVAAYYASLPWTAAAQ